MLKTMIVIAALLVLMAPVVRAEDVSVEVLIEPSVVPVGVEATLLVRVKGKFRRSSDPELPQMPDFDVYQGGTSQNFSFVNGKRSSSLEYRYVIVPHKEGTYKIAPVRFETDGKVYTASPVSIEVVKAAQKLPAPQNDPQGGGDSPIFIEASVDRDTVYVNQQITWTLGFYTDGSINMLRSPQYSPPTAEGFWVEDLPPQKNYYKAIDSKNYLVNELKRAFFPTVPGEYQIGSARVDIVIDDASARVFDDVFRRRRGSFGFGETKSLTTDVVGITVLPLPRRGRPADFSGLVGSDLEIAVRADKQMVEIGSPINVTLEISGTGNFKTMAAPEIPTLQDFKVYESGSSSDMFKDGYVVAGRKKTDFVMIPKKEGDTVIPSIKLSYFDPVARVYKTIQSAPIRMTVTPGVEEDRGRQVIFAGTGEDIEVLDTDIRYIHAVPADIAMSARPVYHSRGVLALGALPLLAAIASVFLERRRRRYQDDSAWARSSRAAREADRRLKQATELSGSGDDEAAMAMVSTALREFFADKINVSAAGLTSDRIADFAAQSDGELHDQVGRLLRLCDSIQYAPTSATPQQTHDAIDLSRTLVKAYDKT